MSPYQPGEPPSFAPPQDPWADVQGSATPTNPIAAVPAQQGPLPQRGQYVPGVAAPTAPTPAGPPPGIWSQETIANSDRYATPRQGSGAGLYVLVALLVVVLGGAGGYGAWYLTKQRVSANSALTQNSTAAQTTSSGTGPLANCVDVESNFDACQVRVGDCLSITGPPNNPTIAMADCADPNSKKVLRILAGTEIGANGLDSQDSTYLLNLYNSKCGGIGSNYYFAWQYPGVGGDRFYCMTTQH